MKNLSKWIKAYYSAFWELIMEIINFNLKENRTLNEKLLDVFFAIFMVVSLHIFCVGIPIIGIAILVLWCATWVSINVTNILALLVTMGIAIAWVYEKCDRNAIVESQQAYLWEDIADYVVCPVLSNVLSKRISKEMLFYFGEPRLGYGYYFTIPYPLENEIMEKALERKVTKRYCDITKTDLKDAIETQRVIIKSDFVFIKG